LVVDPWHWLDENGKVPEGNARLRRRILRVARLIEAAGPLPKMRGRDTLVECARRPGGKACLGLIFVVKKQDDAIHAFCPRCRSDEALIHNWAGTPWAAGPARVLVLEEVDFGAKVH